MTILDQIYDIEGFNNSNIKQWIDIKCFYCGKIHKVRKKRIMRKLKLNEMKFCSRTCFYTHKKITQSVTCLFCNKKFYKTKSWILRGDKHYCSRNCSSKDMWAKRKLNGYELKGRSYLPEDKKNIKKCSICNKELKIKANGIFCIKCRKRGIAEKLKNITLKEFQEKESVRNRHRSWVNSEVRGLCRSWNSNLSGLPCQKCGYNKFTEFCHIKGISEFNLDTKIGIINDPSNIVMLCPNCHWEFDRGLFNINNIKQRNTDIHEIISYYII